LKQWKENFIGPLLLPWRDEYDRPVGMYYRFDPFRDDPRFQDLLLRMNLEL